MVFSAWVIVIPTAASSGPSNVSDAASKSTLTAGAPAVKSRAAAWLSAWPTICTASTMTIVPPRGATVSGAGADNAS